MRPLHELHEPFPAILAVHFLSTHANDRQPAGFIEA
jgi:hypothetical protein